MQHSEQPNPTSGGLHSNPVCLGESALSTPAAMWFKVVVVGLKAAGGTKPKTTEVFCSFSTGDCPAIQDAALAQFCWPLGPENQTPKEFMAPEVS